MLILISSVLLNTVATRPLNISTIRKDSSCNVLSGQSQLTQLHDDRIVRLHPEFLYPVNGLTFEQELGNRSCPSTSQQIFHPNLLIASPENLNPGLAIPPSLSDSIGPVQELENIPLENDIDEDEINENERRNNDDENRVSLFSFDNFNLNYRTDSDNFGGFRQMIEPTATLQLANGDDLRVTTGFNTFDQIGVTRVTNVPLDVGWRRDISASSIELSAGVDWFNRLPIAPRLGFEGSTPLFEGATLSGVIEYQPYKFNARTLENQLQTLRLGPNLFWQINPNTYLFSLLRLGTYSDGNTEQQSFSRLEHKIGNFGVAANLFNWVYRANLEIQSGYFSPPDFLVYNGEIFWEDEIINGVNCKVTASLGQQRLDGMWTSSYSYGPACEVNIADTFRLNLGYDFSNVRDQMTGESAFNNRTVTGSLEIGF